ncbi:MAG: twin-arginine translocation signal domain-containing protein, partial [Planctomycetes bacterium]|nr:twin-arginine translocation signal domain-containing protein [Planctomycetota bacterium]
MQKTRRDFLRTATSALGLAAVPNLAPIKAGAAKTDKPNIVLI